jgi:intracellular septation protein
VPLTGLVMTKLDGTAKGGILVALADKFGIAGPFHRRGRGCGRSATLRCRGSFAKALTGAHERPANENFAPLTRLALDLGPLVIFFAVLRVFRMLCRDRRLHGRDGRFAHHLDMPMSAACRPCRFVHGGARAVVRRAHALAAQRCLHQDQADGALRVFRPDPDRAGSRSSALFIKYMFGQAFELTEEGWRKLTWRWGFFFSRWRSPTKLSGGIIPLQVWVGISIVWVIGPADLLVRLCPGAAGPEARNRKNQTAKDLSEHRAADLRTARTRPNPWIRCNVSAPICHAGKGNSFQGISFHAKRFTSRLSTPGAKTGLSNVARYINCTWLMCGTL